MFISHDLLHNGSTLAEATSVIVFDILKLLVIISGL